MTTPVELLERLRKGNVVLFCGAGISISRDDIPIGSLLAQRADLSDVRSKSLLRPRKPPNADEQGRIRFIHPDFYLYEHGLFAEY